MLLGFAPLSPAADLPRSGTFSGVYHRDRWGVGRFHFYLVSPKLHAQLKELADRPISLEVGNAQQAFVPGPSEILQIGQAKRLESPKVDLELVARNDGLPQRTVEFTCFVTNSSDDTVDFSVGDLIIELYSPRPVKDPDARSVLFPDFTNHQM